MFLSRANADYFLVDFGMIRRIAAPRATMANPERTIQTVFAPVMASIPPAAMEVPATPAFWYIVTISFLDEIWLVCMLPRVLPEVQNLIASHTWLRQEAFS